MNAKHDSGLWKQIQPNLPRNKVFIIDSDSLTVRGLGDLLEWETSDFILSGSATDPGLIFRKFKADLPDVVILDIILPKGSGLKILKGLKLRWPELPVLVHSRGDEGIWAILCLINGASGYLLKSEAPELLIESIRKVLEGEVVASKRIRNWILHRFQRQQDPRMVLSKEEFEILNLLGIGKKLPKISKSLGITVLTVESHLDHARRKLGFRTLEELAEFAKRWMSVPR